MIRMASRAVTALLILAVSLTMADSQVPSFPQTLPANTVVGRLGIGSGPSQAIPFATLSSRLGSNAVSITTGGAVGDGTTDNTEREQAIFNRSGDIYIPPGVFCSRQIILSSNTHIFGPGTLKACGSIAAFQAFIRAPNVTNLTISDITISVDHTTYAGNGSLDIVSGTDVRIENVKLPEAGRFGLQIETCSSCTFQGNTLANYTQTAIEANACGACSFLENRMTAPPGTSGPATINLNVTSGNDLIISRNYSYGAKLWGIHVGDAIRAQITNNNVQDTGAEGITIGATDSNVGTSYVIVSNNDISWGGVGADYGFSIQGFDGTHQVKYTKVIGNRIVNSSNPCIAIASDALYTTVEGNYLVNCTRSGGVGAEQNSAIILDGPRTRDTWIKNNVIWSDGTNITIGIKELVTDIDYSFLDGNTIFGQIGADISLTGANSKVLTSLKPNGTSLLGSGPAVSDNLDLITSTQGAIVSRNASQWIGVAPPSAGLPFVGGGPSANSNFAVLGVVGGGSGQSSYTLGDLLYASGTAALSKLAGNTTSAKQYLSQTGTGSASAAPAWATIAGADITGAALTKADDTNVTLTLGGTPATALLRAASITAGWTGTLALARGGCGAALTASNGGVLYSTASACAILAGTATANLPLLSGASGAPTWAAVSHPTSATSGGIPYFSSTSVMSTSALLTQHQLMIGGGAGAAPFTLGVLGTSTTVLHGNAIGDPSFGAIVSADLNITTTSCTNQFVTAISAGGVGTCTTDTLAGAQHANQGTTATVLHGNAAGNPSWGAVSISADVSGLGTGVATALGLNVGSAGALVVNGGALGTPSSGVATNLTGTASGLTAGAVTTNANLTGDVTSSGNATTIGATKVTSAMLNSDVFSTAHSWGGTQTFTAPVLGTPASGVATNLTGTAAGLTAGAVNTAPSPYTPTPSCSGGGALANVTASGEYQLTGTKQYAVTIKLLADLSTCTGNVQLTLPVSASSTFGAGLVGSNLSNGIIVVGNINPTGPSVVTILGINVTAGVNGNPITGTAQTIVVSGTYFSN